MTGTLPVNLMLRLECRTRLTLLRPSLESKALEKQSAEVSGQWRDFYAGERVMERDIRSQRWLFGVIAERNGPKSYVVQFKGSVERSLLP